MPWALCFHESTLAKALTKLLLPPKPSCHLLSSSVSIQSILGLKPCGQQAWGYPASSLCLALGSSCAGPVSWSGSGSLHCLRRYLYLGKGLVALQLFCKLLHSLFLLLFRPSISPPAPTCLAWLQHTLKLGICPVAQHLVCLWRTRQASSMASAEVHWWQGHLALAEGPGRCQRKTLCYSGEALASFHPSLHDSCGLVRRPLEEMC